MNIFIFFKLQRYILLIVLLSSCSNMKKHIMIGFHDYYLHTTPLNALYSADNVKLPITNDTYDIPCVIMYGSNYGSKLDISPPEELFSSCEKGCINN